MTQGVPGEDEMTSRAGQALIDGEWVPHGRASRIAEAVAAIEQEVRDDIRARLGNPYEWNPGYCPWCDKTMLTEGHASDCLFAAISSSSAPETQDGHADGADCTNSCHDERCIRGHGHFPDSDHTDGVNNWPLPPTETQDGERLRAALEAAASEGRNVVPDATDDDAHIIEEWAATALGTPTPDDRDREVERLIEAYCEGFRQAASFSADRGTTGMMEAATAYRNRLDAGLRASGGTAE